MNRLATPSRNLWILGSIGALLYAVVAGLFWSDAAYNSSSTVRTVLSGIIGILTVGYFLGIQHVSKVSIRTVVFFGVLFAIIGFLSGPVDSTDLYFYMAQGWGQSHYGTNPYINVLRDIPDSANDPLIRSRWMTLNRNPWLDEPMPYGFAFASLTRAVAWLGRGNWWLTFFLFNGMNVLFHAAVAFLLWKTAAHIPGVDGKHVLYLYMWSPLVVLQFLTDAHNDLIMSAFILLAFYLLIKGRTIWTMPCMVVGGLIKHLALALIPFVFCLTWRRHGWKAAVSSVLASIPVLMLFSSLYVTDFNNFKVSEVFAQVAERTGSLQAFLHFGYRAITSFGQTVPVDLGAFSSVANVSLWAIVGIYSAYRLTHAWDGSEDDPVSVATRWTSVMFMIIFVASSQFYPWYIGMLFPLALVGSGTSLLTEIIVLLSGTHMAFGFLRSKAIGYFLLSTLVPIAILIWHRRTGPLNGKAADLLHAGK